MLGDGAAAEAGTNRLDAGNIEAARGQVRADEKLDILVLEACQCIETLHLKRV